MTIDIDVEVGRLEAMAIRELAEQYEEVFGEECRSRHRRYLIRRIAWRLQANAEGGLSQRARDRALELADDAEIRVTAPREKTSSEPSSDGTASTVKMPAPSDPRLPAPGNWIVREYKGRTVQVLVVRDGFEYEGRRYKSLSAVAAEITGSHINGFRFFKLWGKP